MLGKASDEFKIGLVTVLAKRTPIKVVWEYNEGVFRQRVNFDPRGRRRNFGQAPRIWVIRDCPEALQPHKSSHLRAVIEGAAVRARARMSSTSFLKSLSRGRDEAEECIMTRTPPS